MPGGAFGHWLDDLELEQVVRNDVVLAVHEACANAVEHAYAGHEPGEVGRRGRPPDGQGSSPRSTDQGSWRNGPRDPSRGAGAPDHGSRRAGCVRGDVRRRHGRDDGVRDGRAGIAVRGRRPPRSSARTWTRAGRPEIANEVSKPAAIRTRGGMFLASSVEFAQELFEVDLTAAGGSEMALRRQRPRLHRPVPHQLQRVPVRVEQVDRVVGRVGDRRAIGHPASTRRR